MECEVCKDTATHLVVSVTDHQGTAIELRPPYHYCAICLEQCRSEQGPQTKIEVRELR